MIPTAAFVVPVIFISITSVIGHVATLRHREKMERLRLQAGRPAVGLDDRLDRLEQAVETIGVEIERIGEGQRFVTKLLAERAPALPEPVSQRGRVVTPH